MIAAALLRMLLAYMPPEQPSALPPPPPTAAQQARAERAADFRDCLDDRDLTAEDNDGECEEP